MLQLRLIKTLHTKTPSIHIRAEVDAVAAEAEKLHVWEAEVALEATTVKEAAEDKVEVGMEEDTGSIRMEEYWFIATRRTTSASMAANMIVQFMGRQTNPVVGVKIIPPHKGTYEKNSARGGLERPKKNKETEIINNTSVTILHITTLVNKYQRRKTDK